MRVKLPIVLGIAIAGTLTTSVAQDGRRFDTAEQCMQSGTSVFNMPTCVNEGDGWVAQFPDDRFPDPPGSGAFAGFLVFALVWAAAPAAISGFIASDRGQNVGLAVLLGVILGWIGLLIVYLAFKPEVERAARGVIQTYGGPSRPVPIPRAEGPSSTFPAGSSASTAAPRSRSAADRLAELEDLKTRGLVTDDEYASRRAAIIEQI